MRRLFAGAAAAVAIVACFAAATTAGAAPVAPSNDPFYSYQGSLSGFAPGAVLRTRQVPVGELGITVPIAATQVLYRTTNELGQPTATVATIIKPLLPLGKTRLVGFQQAYDALGSQCDATYTIEGGNPGDGTANTEDAFIDTYLVAGFTVVDSNYEGPTLDYGAGQESGYGTLDAIRAAESVLKLSAATTPVGLVGYSGGAIASEYAAELQPKYAPSLDLVGTAIGGIPVDYAHTFNYIGGSSGWAGAIAYVMTGLARAFKLNFPQYLSAYGAQVVGQVSNGCLDASAYPGLTFSQMLKPQYQDYARVPQFAHMLNDMIMSRSGTPGAPLLMIAGNSDGTGDGVMIQGDVQELAYTYCQRGVSVEYDPLRGLNHIAAALTFEPLALTFLTQRLNGLPVTDRCSSVTPGNPLTPLPLPPTKKRAAPTRHRA